MAAPSSPKPRFLLDFAESPLSPRGQAAPSHRPRLPASRQPRRCDVPSPLPLSCNPFSPLLNSVRPTHVGTGLITLLPHSHSGFTSAIEVGDMLLCQVTTQLTRPWLPEALRPSDSQTQDTTAPSDHGPSFGPQPEARSPVSALVPTSLRHFRLSLASCTSQPITGTTLLLLSSLTFII